MRNARIAEWILSLVTSSDRAAAAVGDLMEDVGRRGALRFWASVWHLAMSLLVRDFTANPVRMVGLGALGILFELLLFVVGRLAIGLLLRGRAARFVECRALRFLSISPPGCLRRSRHNLMDWLDTQDLSSPVLELLVEFQVGRMLARRSPGREVAPCVATAILGTTIGAVLEIFSGGRMHFSMLDLTLYQIPFLVPLFAGAVRVRRGRNSPNA